MSSAASPVAIASRITGWFTESGSPTPLAVYRMLVAGFCILNITLIRASLLDVYGQYGIVQWLITRANLYPGLPHLGDLAALLLRVGISPDQSVYIVVGAFLVVLVGLLFGIATRFMAIAAWGIHFLLIHAGGGLIYGMDIFAHIALMFCAIMPVGAALSVDLLFARRPARWSVAAGFTRKLLQIQMCAVYFSAGLEKALSTQWVTGDAIWRATMLPTFRQFDMTWLAWVPAAALLIGWSVIALELGYSIAMWFPRTRTLWMYGVIAMHLGIGMLLGMWLFALIMIVLNVGAFGYEALPRSFWSRLERRSRPPLFLAEPA